MKNQAISKTVISITVVVLLITAGIYFSSKMSPQNDALRTYTNSTYGVTFDYPERYDLTERSVGGNGETSGIVVILTNKGAIIPQNGEGPTAITVEMYDNDVIGNEGGNSIENWILSSTSSNFHLSGQDRPGETRIGEKNAWLYTWDGLYQGTSVAMEHNGNIIVFSVTYDGDADMEKRRDFTALMDSVQFDGATSATTTSLE